MKYLKKYKFFEQSVSPDFTLKIHSSTEDKIINWMIINNLETVDLTNNLILTDVPGKQLNPHNLLEMILIKNDQGKHQLDILLKRYYNNGTEKIHHTKLTQYIDSICLDLLNFVNKMSEEDIEKQKIKAISKKYNI